MESIFPEKQEDKVGTWLLYTWVYKIKNKSEGINVESASPFYNKAFSFSSTLPYIAYFDIYMHLLGQFGWLLSFLHFF